MSSNKIVDSLLGDVTLSHRFSEKHSEYEACVSVWDREVQVVIYSNPDTGETASAIANGRSIVQNFAQHKSTLVAHLQGDFFPKFRDNSGADCSANDLIGELDLQNITVHADGNFSLGFNACETLFDHALVVYFSKDGCVDECDTPG